MNASYKIVVPLGVIFLSMFAACGKPDAVTAREPLVTAATQPPPVEPMIHTDAGGIRATYTPHFENEQLLQIAEERVLSSGASARGQYQYQGARLLRYSGDAFSDRDPLTVELNLQGAVVAASKAGGQAPEEEVAQVRSRAQLLRNHALAQRATRVHME